MLKIGLEIRQVEEHKFSVVLEVQKQCDFC